MVYKRAATPVNLRNQHFQNAGRGPGTGPSGPHFENVDFEGKGLKAATPPPLGVRLGCPWAPLGCPWVPVGCLWAPKGSPLGPKALGTVLGGGQCEFGMHFYSKICVFGTHPRIQRIQRIQRILRIRCHQLRFGTSLPRAPGVRMT